MAKSALGAVAVGEDRKWKIARAADTLLEAAEIRADAKLFAAAKAVLKKRKKAISITIQQTGLSQAILRTK